MVGLVLLSITFNTSERLGCMMILNFMRLTTMSSVMVTVMCPRCVHLVL